MDQSPAAPQPPKVELSQGTADIAGTSHSERPALRRQTGSATPIAIVASLVALAALGASVWAYADTRREILLLATDVAQLRLSLDLYARRTPAASAAAPADTGQLTDLSNRLAILEQEWRDRTAAAAAPAAASAPSTGAQPGAECLPSGMRILVAAGDRYPICDTTASVEVSTVDNGYISLSDGTTVPSGGTMALGASGCMIGVTSGGDEGVTGYAEIRVTC